MSHTPDIGVTVIAVILEGATVEGDALQRAGKGVEALESAVVEDEGRIPCSVDVEEVSFLCLEFRV
ncbi:MAG: hypothetical protein IIY01_05490 [Clostridia bacterium]|nr:hypothetical protein [Clostridia bacterium]